MRPTASPQDTALANARPASSVWTSSMRPLALVSKMLSKPAASFLDRASGGQTANRKMLHSSLLSWMRRSHRSEEHTSELQSLMRISYAVFCLKKKNRLTHKQYEYTATTLLPYSNEYREL